MKGQGSARLLALAGIASAVLFLGLAVRGALRAQRAAEPAPGSAASFDAEASGRRTATAARATSPLRLELPDLRVRDAAPEVAAAPDLDAETGTAGADDTLIFAAGPMGLGRAGVPVWFSGLSGTAGRPLGSTDASGLLACSLGTEGGELRAVSDEWIGSTLLAPGPRAATDPVVIALTPAASLSGVVVDHAGAPVGAGVEVLGFPAGVRQSGPQSLDQTAAQRGAVRRAVTDESSAFVLRGLPPGADLGLRAAGAGYAAAGPVVLEDLAPGAPDIELRVLPLFAVLIDLLQPDGAPAAIAPELINLDAERALGQAPEFGVHPHRSHAARANGLDLFQRGELPVHRRLFLFTAAQDPARPLSLHYLTEFPGYLPGECSLEAPAAVSGELGRFELTLEPSATEFGELTLIAEGPEPGSLLPLPAGQLRLIVDGHADTFAVPRALDGLGTVRGIPAGTYALRYRSDHGLLRWPTGGELPPQVTVGADSSSAVLAHRPRGALHVVALHTDGRPLAGSLQFGVVRAENVVSDPQGGLLLERVAPIQLDTAPYFVRDLPPGDYYLAPAEPQPLDGALLPFTVRDGETTRVELPGL